MAKAARAAKAGGSLTWLHGLICGALLAFATPTAVMLAALLLPSVFAFLGDGAPGRPVAKAVFLCGVAGSLPPVWRLWMGTHGMAECVTILAQPASLGLAWLAGALGWLIAELTPVVVKVALDRNAAAHVKRLRDARQKIEEEWGLGPPI